VKALRESRCRAWRNQLGTSHAPDRALDFQTARAPDRPIACLMISPYDTLNIAFYFAFIVGVGFYFARRNKDSSDYFRGGGVMPWWVTGASSWMAGFTAWTFVGAAGKIYETGTYVVVLYYQSVLAYVVLYLFTCYRFRRLRVVTPMEALRLRFGPVTQQFYTWMRLPIQLIFAGFVLNAVSVFMAAVFGVEMTTLIIALGLLVTLISLLGGVMGVAACDFVQMFLIVLVAAVTGLLAFAHPAIGGVTGLIERVPAAHFAWGEIARPQFIFLWWFALSLNTVFNFNSLSDDKSVKYMMAQSDAHARRMIAIPMLGTLIGPLFWIVPPMAAAVLFPQLGTLFPQLPFPNEAAFLATAREVMPNGMLGLLICCIFAASLTDMSSTINWGAGLLIRNFYLPVINPNCAESRLVPLSRFAALGLGVVLVGFAYVINQYRSLGLFDLLNQVGTSLLLPLAIPAFLGLYFKRTPPWSAWTTALIGFVASLAVSPKPVTMVIGLFTETPPTLRFVTPEMLAWILGLGGPLSGEEQTQFGIIATVALVGGISTAWFFFTSVFYKRTTPEYQASVEEFFARARTPLVDNPGAALPENRAYPRAIGRMCLIYGGFILLCALIPNALTGRLCFLGCGGVIAACGLLLRRRYRSPVKFAPIVAPLAETVERG
jgi:solute:Na+ symporter, SSS family